MSKKPTLTGYWRHSCGQIFCGTRCIAKADFDANPAPEFCTAVFDDICDGMNQMSNLRHYLRKRMAEPNTPESERELAAIEWLLE